MLDYGYEIKNGAIVLHPVNSLAVEKMHHIYLESESIYKVIEYLDASEYYSPKGNKNWNRSTVRRILGNPVYKGTEFLPRLLSDEIIDKVAELLESKYVKKQIDTKADDEVLRSIICSECNSIMFPDKNNEFYQCKCGMIVDTAFIKDAFYNLSAAIHENPEMIEQDEVEAPVLPAVDELTKQIDSLLKQASYSNYSVIELLKERAMLTYSMLELNEKEIQSMKLLNLFYRINQIDSFEIELYRMIINSVKVYGPDLVLIELINGQQFEIQKED